MAKQNKKNPKWVPIVISLTALAAGIALILVGLINTLLSGKNKTAEETGGNPTETLEPVDMEDYLSGFGRVTGQEPAKKAGLLTEAEAAREFKARGFTVEPVTASYTADGEYTDVQEISADSKNKHPYYETYYRSSSGVIWGIVLMGDTFCAEPITYNADTIWDVPHELSESGIFTAYDGSSNAFYTVSPDEDALIVKRIDRIDAGTLEELGAWEVEEL